MTLVDKFLDLVNTAETWSKRSRKANLMEKYVHFNGNYFYF